MGTMSLPTSSVLHCNLEGAGHRGFSFFSGLCVLALSCMSCVFSVIQSYAHVSNRVAYVARFQLQLLCCSISAVTSLCCDYVVTNFQSDVEDPWH